MFISAIIKPFVFILHWVLCSEDNVQVAKRYSSKHLEILDCVHASKTRGAWECSQECSSNVEYDTTLVKQWNASGQSFGPCQLMFFWTVPRYGLEWETIPNEQLICRHPAWESFLIQAGAILCQLPLMCLGAFSHTFHLLVYLLHQVKIWLSPSPPPLFVCHLFKERAGTTEHIPGSCLHDVYLKLVSSVCHCSWFHVQWFPLIRQNISIKNGVYGHELYAAVCVNML